METLHAHLPELVALWLGATVLLAMIGGLIARFVVLPLLSAQRPAQPAPGPALARLEQRLARLEARLAERDGDPVVEPWRGPAAC